MAARFNFAAAFLVLLTVAASLRRSSAATHVVGDGLGWTIPPTASTYSTWASSQTFAVGDILVFNFANGQHDVTEVMKPAFDSCTATNPISVTTNGPARITLNTSGDHHFICGFPGHCSAGQKLSVTVSSSSSPPPPSAAPSPPPTTPSPTPTPAVAPSPPSTTPSPTPTPAAAPGPAPSRRSPPPSGAPPQAAPPTATPPTGTAAPPPSDAAPPTATPPPPNSANSHGCSSFFSAILAIVVALIY